MDAYRKSELEELEDDFLDPDDLYTGPDVDQAPTTQEILGVDAMFRRDTRMRQISQARYQTSIGYDDSGDQVRPLDFG